MTFNYELIDEILAAIFPLPEQFGLVEYNDDDDSEPINYSFLKEAIFEVDPYAKIYFGASKLVITSYKLGGVVIKIPFNGYYTENEITGELDWTYFYNAPSSDETDYCLAEYEKFQKLAIYGLDCFVAKTVFYKTINGFRIFIQEVVTPEEDIYDEYCPSQKSQKIADEWRKQGIFYMNSKWIANCLDIYGESEVKRFLNYCNNIDKDILEDAHSGNFGYRNDDSPAFLDYSNFLE